jgi:crotonobetainyl-CoA:carnitine CoA-transferase CaiB-like acyl-CoA transferase
VTDGVPGALAGVRVLDLSRVLAGPWATQLLADLGAEVIKIEKPGEGDETRAWGPPWLENNGAREAAYFLSANRGKRSVTIDIARPEGAVLVTRLAAQSDVLIENFKVGGLAKYGLDYASLAAANPGLVYCSITGFGQDGPYADRPGYDFVIQAMGGLMSLTGDAEGAPMKAGVALTDLVTGLYAANAIQAALRHRDRTGQGQHIDVALLDVQVAALANQALNYLVSGANPRRWGNAHPNIAPYQSFATLDGDIAIAAGNDGQFARLCEVLGLRELPADPRFTGNAERVVNRAALIAALQAAFAADTTAEWLKRLHAAGVPAGAVNRLDAVFADPQVVHRGLATTLPHPTLGAAPGVACPIRLSQTPVGAVTAPPPLGHDTRAVLAERLGLDAMALDRLEADGVL